MTCAICMQTARRELCGVEQEVSPNLRWTGKSGRPSTVWRGRFDCGGVAEQARLRSQDLRHAAPSRPLPRARGQTARKQPGVSIGKPHSSGLLPRRRVAGPLATLSAGESSVRAGFTSTATTAYWGGRALWQYPLYPRPYNGSGAPGALPIEHLPASPWLSSGSSGARGQRLAAPEERAYPLATSFAVHSPGRLRLQF